MADPPRRRKDPDGRLTVAVATDEDRKFMVEQGFALRGDTFSHKDGRSIAAVWVDPSDSRRGTFMRGSLDTPKNREVMWHAAMSKMDHSGYEGMCRTKPVGSPCVTPTACFIQAELVQWT